MSLWRSNPHPALALRAMVLLAAATLLAVLVPAGVSGQQANTAPQFQGDVDTRRVNESTAAGQPVGAPVTATDPDNDTLTYSISGRDVASFAINTATGQLSIGASLTLDYESRNSYDVTVSVTDSKDSAGNPSNTVDDSIDVTIEVGNVEEAGSVTLSPPPYMVGSPVTATLADPDGGVSGAVRQWEISADGNAPWSVISGAASESYTPKAGDAGKFLRATVTYTDGHGPGKSAQSASTAQAVQTPDDCANGPALANFPGNADTLADCNILLAAKDQLRGRASLNWNFNRDLRQWDGVSISGQRVVVLDLDAHGLTGTIPGGLGGLSALTRLDLRNNDLTGTIPDGLGGLSALTQLDLGNNELTGPIPTELGNLSRLTDLILSNNALSGTIPTSLGDLTGLRNLRLDENRLEGSIPAVLGDLPVLRFLYLDDNRLQGEFPRTLAQPGSVLAFFDFDENGGEHPRRDQLYIAYTITPDENNATDLFEGGTQDSVTLRFEVTLLGMVENLRARGFPTYRDDLADQLRLAWFLRVVDVSDGTIVGGEGQGLIDPMRKLTPEQCVTTKVPPEGPADLDPSADPNGLSLDTGASSLTFTLSCRIDTTGAPGTYTGDKQLRFRVEGRALPDDSNALIRPVQAGNPPIFTLIDVDVDIQGEEQQQVLENEPFSLPLRLLGHYRTPVTWTKSGPDAGQFTIRQDGSDFFLEMTAKDYESPLDQGGNNTYMVTINAASDDAPPKSAVKDFTVTVQDVLAIPQFLEGFAAQRSVPETAAVGQKIGEPLTATKGDDAETSTLTYSLVGTDAADFAIDTATGQLSVKTPLDFETKSSYEVVVWVTDSVPDTSPDNAVTVAISVSDVNELPVIEGASEVPRQPERRYVGTYTVSDPDTLDPRDDELLWTLAGTDAAQFEISGAGDLTFLETPDYEDSNQQKSFSIIVQVSDQRDPGYNLDVEVDDTHSVSITLVNSDEPGRVTLDSHTLRVGTGVIATLTDPDGAPMELTWQWEGSPDKVDWTAIAGANSAAYTPVYADTDVYLRAVARYTDPHGPGKIAESQPTENPTLGICDGTTAIAAYPGNTGIRDDCNALLGARDPLRGRDILNWSTTVAIATWDGVTVSSSTPQRVTVLDLNSRSLAGTVPAPLGDLDALITLNLADNLLTGEIPAALGGLNALITLDLDDNKLSGAIPTELGSLSALATMDLAGNELTGGIPTELGGLSALATMDLADNELTGGIPAALGSLNVLATLDLADNGLTGAIPAGFAAADKLVKLESLSLTGNQLTGTVTLNVQPKTLAENVAAPATLTFTVTVDAGTAWAAGFSITGGPPVQLVKGLQVTSEPGQSRTPATSLPPLSFTKDVAPGAAPRTFTVEVTPDNNDIEEHPQPYDFKITGGTGASGVADTRLEQVVTDNPHRLLLNDDDGSPPSIVSLVRKTPAEQITNADTLVWTLTFNEEVKNVDGDGSNFTTSETATFSVATTDNIVYTITLSGGNLASLNGDVTIGLHSTGQDITDLFDKPLSTVLPTGDLYQPTYTLDNTAPTVALTTDHQAANGGAPVTVTATFSEDMKPGTFTEADIAVTNSATKSNFQETTANRIYTVTVTPTANGDIGISVPSGSAQDRAGNDNEAASATITITVSLGVTAPASLTVAENAAYSGTPALTGTPIGDVTWSLEGTDAALLSINAATGALSMVARNYEDPADADDGNDYEITVKAVDEDGNEATLAITIRVTDVTESADLGVTAPASLTVAENAAYAGTPTLTGTPIGAVAWSLEGTDAALLSINAATGALSMVARNYEDPADADDGNDYEVTVKAEDEDGNEATLAITIRVTDVTESATLGITAPAVVTVPENTAYAGSPTLTGTPIGGVTWSLEGTDAALLSINAATGALAMVARNYENPADSDGGNDYEITVKAEDEDGNEATASFTVSVTDVVGTSTLGITAPAVVTVPENTAYSGTPTLTGTPVGDVTWSLEGTDAALLSINATTGALAMIARNYEDPADSDEGNDYEITVKAIDAGENPASLAITIRVTDVTESADLGITAPSSLTVPENTAYSGTPTLTGTPIGDVTWSLEGTDAALLSINATTGALAMVARDYENPADSDRGNDYEITVKAEDEDGNEATLAITIRVTDVVGSANLGITAPAVVTVPENAAYSGTPTLTGTPIGDVTWSLEGTDAALLSINATTGALAMIARNYEDPADSDEGNDYEITVKAIDAGENPASLAITIRVTDVTESADLGITAPPW